MNNLYLLYSKKDLNKISDIVNELKLAFKKSRIEILMDDDQVLFKDSYRNFYDKIGNSKFVIMLITDSFLKDKICMSIAFQLSKYKDFTERVFPIVFSDAKIFNAVESIDYIQFWENQKSSLEKKIRTLNSFEHLNAIMQDINSMSNIRIIISQFIAEVSNMFSVSLNDIQQNNYEKLILAINSKIA
jgi:hypothetical protein